MRNSIMQRASHPRRPLAVLMATLLLAGLTLAGCSSSENVNGAHIRSPRGGELSYDDNTAPYGEGGFYSETMSFEDILEKCEVTEGVERDGTFSKGGYIVSEDGIMKPGLYYVEGSPTEMGTYEICKPSHKTEGMFRGAYAIEYFGFYLAELQEGDVIVYLPANDESVMYLAPETALDVHAPYTSGCYRVGIDIPAGTYTVAADPDISYEDAQADSSIGAYIMKDLLFNEDSVEEKVLVEGNESASFTVSDGQYLELFAAVAALAA